MEQEGAIDQLNAEVKASVAQLRMSVDHLRDLLSERIDHVTARQTIALTAVGIVIALMAGSIWNLSRHVDQLSTRIDTVVDELGDFKADLAVVKEKATSIEGSILTIQGSQEMILAELSLIKESISDDLPRENPTANERIDRIQGNAQPSLLDLLLHNEKYSNYTALIETAQMRDILRGDGPYTLFAPTNQAFESGGGERVFGDLIKLENRDALWTFITRYIAPGRHTTSELARVGKIQNIQGQELVITEDLKVNDANLVETDLLARNGIVHGIDGLWVPAER